MPGSLTHQGQEAADRAHSPLLAPLLAPLLSPLLAPLLAPPLAALPSAFPGGRPLPVGQSRAGVRTALRGQRGDGDTHTEPRTHLRAGRARGALGAGSGGAGPAAAERRSQRSPCRVARAGPAGGTRLATQGSCGRAGISAGSPAAVGARGGGRGQPRTHDAARRAVLVDQALQAQPLDQLAGQQRGRRVLLVGQPGPRGERRSLPGSLTCGPRCLAVPAGELRAFFGRD